MRTDQAMICSTFVSSREFNVAPVEGSANGKLVIDLTMHGIGWLIAPIELSVK